MILRKILCSAHHYEMLLGHLVGETASQKLSSSSHDTQDRLSVDEKESHTDISFLFRRLKHLFESKILLTFSVSQVSHSLVLPVNSLSQPNRTRQGLSTYQMSFSQRYEASLTRSATFVPQQHFSQSQPWQPSNPTGTKFAALYPSSQPRETARAFSQGAEQFLQRRREEPKQQREGNLP
jgi:hypothetical protein